MVDDRDRAASRADSRRGPVSERSRPPILAAPAQDSRFAIDVSGLDARDVIMPSIRIA